MLNAVRDERAAVQLIELLIGCLITALVLGSVFFAYDIAVNNQSRAEARSRASVNADLALSKMARDLRQATWFFGGGSTQQSSEEFVDFNALLKPATSDTAPVARHVRYECTRLAYDAYPLWNIQAAPPGGNGGVCTRHEGPAWDGVTTATWDTTNVVLTNTRTAIWGSTPFTPPFKIDPESTTDAGNNTVYNACPSTITVRLAIRIKNTLGSRAPDPRNAIALSDAVQPRNPCVDPT